MKRDEKPSLSQCVGRGFAKEMSFVRVAKIIQIAVYFSDNKDRRAKQHVVS